MKWFRNLLIYRLQDGQDFSVERLSQALEQHPFVPCSRHELSRSGWVSPCSAEERPLFGSTGRVLLALMREDKVLPASVIREAVQQRVDAIEQQEGRKVFRKEREQLKDEVTLELLPRAFSRRTLTRALLLPESGWLLVDAGSFKAAELLLNALREALGSLRVTPVAVNEAPATHMSLWLQEPTQQPSGFELEDECELRDTSAEGGVIRIKGQYLCSDEIRAHLDTGMQATRLALCWQSQLRFILHSDLSLHRLRLSDQLQEQLEQDSSDDEYANFDALITHMSLEFHRLIPALLDCFGGEAKI